VLHGGVSFILESFTTVYDFMSFFPTVYNFTSLSLFVLVGKRKKNRFSLRDKNGYPCLREYLMQAQRVSQRSGDFFFDTGALIKEWRKY
jgi:hypothetical protein